MLKVAGVPAASSWLARPRNRQRAHARPHRHRLFRFRALPRHAAL